MTWQEVDEIKKAVKMAIVPVGSTEQHGPHLPVKHDAASVSYIAERLAETLYPMLLVTPCVPFGVSFHHMRFPGTISLNPDTLTSIIIDICESLMSHGIKKILILNGHGGNFETISTAIVTANRKLGADIFHANYWDFFPKPAYRIVEDEQVPGHSSDFETSMGLHMYPEMVRTHLIKDSDHVTTRLSNSEKLLSEKSRMYRLELEKSPSGVPEGNPTLASAKKGQQILDAIVTELVSFIEAMIQDA